MRPSSFCSCRIEGPCSGLLERGAFTAGMLARVFLSPFLGLLLGPSRRPRRRAVALTEAREEASELDATWTFSEQPTVGVIA
jgi:hypothetical protein